MSRQRSRGPKLGLLVGYASLALAVVVARGAPAASYELSVYAATPLATWLALGGALVAGTLVAVVQQEERYLRPAGLALIAAVALSVYAMPVLRGYAFYGAGDALSHVGWAREIADGTLSPTGLLYPGIHTLTVFAARVAGVPLALANEYVVLVAAPLSFLLFVPATARLFVDHPHTTLAGLLAAASFAPINNVSVHPVAHPASQAILLFAFVLYLAVAVAAGGLTSASRSGRTRVVGGSALLALAGAALVFVHPQQGLNLAAFLGGATALQLGVRRLRPHHPIADTRSLLPHAAFVGTVFLLWAPQFERVRGAVVVTFGGLIRGGTGAAVVADKSTSLTSVGGSLLEVFVKLFGAAAVLSLLAAAVFVLAARRHRRRPLLLLLVAGLVPVVGVFLVVFAAGMGDQYFRYQGFLMVPVTVAGTVGLLWVARRISLEGGERAGLTVAVVVLLVLAPAGLAALHSSPYVYKPTQHVTATGIDGHAAAFDHRVPEVPFTGVRGGPRRYVDYHYGTERARERLAFPGYRQGTPPSVFLAANYSEALGGSRYLVTTEATMEQETELYDGFRYPERGFRALTRTPGIDRLRASDGFWLYYTDGGEE